MTWQIFVAINLITASLIVPLQRVLLRHDKSDPIAFIIVSQLLTGLVLVPFVLIHGFHAPSLRKYGIAIAAMFVLYSIGNALYATTLKKVEASVFSTLLSTSSAWVMVMGFVFLHEKPSVSHVAGAALVLLSTALLIKRKSRYRLDRTISMGLLMGVIFGVALSLWVYIGKHSDLLTWTMLSFVGTPIILLIVKPKPRHTLGHFFKDRMLLKMLVLAVVWATDNLASLAAYQRTNVSVVAPLLQTSVILSVLVAVIFLKERNRLRWKIAASVVCFVGAVLLI
jgi:drug/metabolite transporter (DMT)-like permease